MSTPCLEGLRLALLDGSLSIRRSEAASVDPNAHGALMIESLEIAEARYMGRSASGDRSRRFRMTLNPWLNAVIGGRGTGKSTVVEFVRTALDRERELPEALKPDYEKYRKQCANRGDEGLLTQNSQFDVIYRKDWTRYKICWTSASKSSSIHVDDGEGGWREEQGDVAQRFPVRVYSQKQIFELAKDPFALLRIVDEAEEVNRAKWDEDWRAEENRFLSLRVDARRRAAELGDESRLMGELEDLKRKLEAFEGTDHAAVLKEYQRRQRESGAVDKWESTLQFASSRVRDLARSIVPQPLARETFDQWDQSATDLLGKSGEVVDGLIKLQKRLEELAAEIDALSRRWAERRRRQDELDGIYKQAAECLDRLGALRQELTQRRREFIGKVLAQNPYVRIHVIPYGNKDAAESELRRLLQRDSGGFEKDIGTPEDGDSLLGRLYQGSSDPKDFEIRLQSLKAKLRDIAGGNTILLI
jgi:uncharacterized protein YukE